MTVRLVGSQKNGILSLTAACLKLGKFVSPLPRHYSNKYESVSLVKFKVFPCYFVNNTVSEHEADYAVLQQSKSQHSPVFMNELLVRLNHGNYISSSSSRYHGFGSLVDPLRSHTSRGVFNGGNAIPKHALPEAKGPNPNTGFTLFWACNNVILMIDKSHNKKPDGLFPNDESEVQREINFKRTKFENRNQKLRGT